MVTWNMACYCVLVAPCMHLRFSKSSVQHMEEHIYIYIYKSRKSIGMEGNYFFKKKKKYILGGIADA